MAALASAVIAGTASAAGFQPLPDFTMREGLKINNPVALSADGSTLVGFATDPNYNTRSLYHWTAATGYTEIFYNAWSNVQGISADGTTVVGNYSNPPVHYETRPFRWTMSGGLKELALPAGAVRGGVGGVSADGSVLVGSAAGDGIPRTQTALRWTQGGQAWHALDSEQAGIFGAGATFVSGDGNVVSGMGNRTDAPDWTIPFRWTPQTGMVPLVTPQQQDQIGISQLRDMTADGSVIVGTTYEDAFRWSEATGAVRLPRLPNTLSQTAASISDDGRWIVGGARVLTSPNSTTSVAVLWDEQHGARPLKDVLTQDFNLDLTGWSLTGALISGDGGTMAGWGTNPQGVSQSWIATLDVITPPRLPGDANLDGTVNSTDFTILREHFDTTNAQWTDGDFNDDQRVDFADFQIQERHFGATREQASSGVTPVPEPGAFALVGLAASAFLLRRPRLSLRRSGHSTRRAAAFTCAALAGTASASSFQGLPYYPGMSRNTPTGLSADGSVLIGQASDAGLNNHVAYRWTPQGGFTQITSGSGFPVYARDISADGSVVVGFDYNVGAFRWTAEQGRVPLPRVPATPDVDVRGISDDGSVAVGGAWATGAVRWTPSGPEVLDPGTSNLIWPIGAVAASADGSVLVGQGEPKERPGQIARVGFRWTPQTGMVRLPPAPGELGIRTSVLDVTADGTVVVGSDASRAFRWSEQAGTVILPLPGTPSADWEATAVSNDGNLISINARISKPEGGSTSQAYLWDPEHGAREVDDILADFGLTLDGWHLQTIDDISGDGTTLVGRGVNPIGFDQAWIATLDVITPPRLPGDANLDGTVNFTDFTILREHFDTTGAQWGDGDFNNDQRVDFADFQIQERHFGATRAGAPAAASISSVPEPAGAFTLTLIGASLLPRRRR